jgi:hypothetical protein
MPLFVFRSGGTKITVEGTHLDNANSARLTVNYMQDIEVILLYFTGYTKLIEISEDFQFFA